MGTFFETLYDVLFQPRVAMRQIAAEKKIGQAVIVVLFSIIIPMWAFYFGLKSSGIENAFVFFAAIQLVGTILMWIVGSALWHLIAEFFGGEGTALGLLCGLGYAHLPRVFIVPLWVLAALLPAGGRTFTMGLTGLAIAVWLLYLDITALKEAHNITTAKAVLVFLAPVLVLFAIILAILICMGTAMIKLPGF